MANLTQVMELLNIKGAAVSTADLAKELTASLEGTRKQLARLKDKGYVDGDSQEGWLITDAGRKELGKGEIHPSMMDEEVTPRQQFEAIARRIGIKGDRIVLAADIVWSGDYNDVKWIWEALGQADVADDLRRVWVNAWRAKLQKGVPPELETELVGVAKSPAGDGGSGESRIKVSTRDYIIVDDEPVRVGPNLGDYSLQDAKDIMAIRVLRNRFAGAGQPGAASQSGTGEKVSDLIAALTPLLNKDSNVDTLKELLTDKLALQRQEILSHIPQPGATVQPKSFMDQATGFVTALGILKDAGPMLRSILGVPEPSIGNPVSNPEASTDERLQWRKFLAEERRANEKHDMLMGLGQTARENMSDGISAIKAAAEEAKRGAGAKTTATPPAQQQPVFVCGDCKTQFSPPAGWIDQPLKCPNPECGREYTKEELAQ